MYTLFHCLKIRTPQALRSLVQTHPIVSVCCLFSVSVLLSLMSLLYVSSTVLPCSRSFLSSNYTHLVVSTVRLVEILLFISSQAWEIWRLFNWDDEESLMWIHFIQVLLILIWVEPSLTLTRNRKLGFRLLLGLGLVDLDSDGPIVARLEAQWPAIR